MFKKGESRIIISIITILLVLIAITINWIVITNIISENSEQISLDKITIRISIENALIKNNNLEVKIKRNPGKGELVKIKFIATDNLNSEIFEEKTTMLELESKTFILSLTKINSSEITEIWAIPIWKSKSGKEILGSSISKFKFNLKNGNFTEWNDENNDEDYYNEIAGRVWYVRPIGGNYGNGDGRSYENAWNGLMNITWGNGGIQPGDTLYVAGLHVYNLTTRGYLVSQAILNITSGTSENKRVIIRGDYPGDKGIIWGAYGMSHEQWVDEGEDVWSIRLAGNQYPDWFFQDINPLNKESFIVLDKETSIENVRNHPGSHYSTDYAGSTGSRLYVKLTDSGNPTGRIYANRYGYKLNLDNKKYITFLNLGFYNLGTGIKSSTSVTNIRWEGCKMIYGAHSLFSFYDGQNNMEIINCDLSWASNGIYFISSSNNSPNNYLIKGNYIHEIGVRKTNQNSDAHCIGIQGGENGIIEKNILENAGTGITLYAFTEQKLKNVTVRYNKVQNLHTLGGANSRGIETQCNNDAMGDKTKNIFHHNIVTNASTGYRFQFEDEQEIYNNIAYNCNTGLTSTRSQSVLKFKNRIFTPNKNDIMTGKISGASAKIRGIKISNSTSGTLSYRDKIGTFIDGENLIVNGNSFAQLDGNPYTIGANIKLRNNLFLNNNNYHINWASGSSKFIINSDYNLFWPMNNNLLKINVLGGEMNLTKWKSLSKENCIFDRNSISSDAKLISPENKNFHPQSNSPIINAGINIQIFKDFEGKIIPKGSSPDIGIFEDY